MSPATAGVDRRSSLRTFLIPTRLTLVKLGPDNGGIVLDASEGGLRVQAVGPVLTGACCTIEIDSPDDLARLSATGIVAWSSDSNVAGLRFVDLAPFSQRSIVACLLGTACLAPSPEFLSRESGVHALPPPSCDESPSETPASGSTRLYPWLLGKKWFALASGLSGVLVVSVCLWTARKPVIHVNTDKIMNTASAPLPVSQPNTGQDPANTVELKPAAVPVARFHPKPVPARQQLRRKRRVHYRSTDVDREPEVVIRVFRNGNWEQMPRLHQ